MFKLNFSLTNPFSDRWHCIFNKAEHLTKNKVWEIQIDESNDIFTLLFRWNFRTDHAGVEINVGLFGYHLILVIYDVRHWDDEINAYAIASLEHDRLPIIN